MKASVAIHKGQRDSSSEPDWTEIARAHQIDTQWFENHHVSTGILDSGLRASQLHSEKDANEYESHASRGAVKCGKLRHSPEYSSSQRKPGRTGCLLKKELGVILFIKII